MPLYSNVSFSTAPGRKKKQRLTLTLFIPVVISVCKDGPYQKVTARYERGKWISPSATARDLETILSIQ